MEDRGGGPARLVEDDCCVSWETGEIAALPQPAPRRARRQAG
ncbi:hypothetical protein BN2537_15671 [Streptomyces venezuelae]|nr:hypothetical protein BN2537_15671 [Streptomyces venezuelae]